MNRDESDQLTWLKNDLSNIGTKIKFKIIIMHVPFYSSGIHGNDEYFLKDDIEPLFIKYGIDAIWAGHDHNYERSSDKNGIIHITTGGGGAPSYPQAGVKQPLPDVTSHVFNSTYHYCRLNITGGDKILVDVIEVPSGNVIDSFTIFD